MLTRFTVRGFKTLRDLSLPLAPITLLVGANNVGKTNVVRALELLASAVDKGSLRRAVEESGGTAAVQAEGSDGSLLLAVEGRLGPNQFKYELGTDLERLVIEGPDGCSAGRLSGSFQSPWSREGFTGEPGAGLHGLFLSGTTPLAVKSIINFIRGMRAVDFSPERLREPSLPSNNVKLGREGQNLAAVLDRLAGERPGLRRQVDAEVHRAIPSLDAVVTIPLSEGLKVIGVAEGDRVFRADSVSDGILLFIALSTIAQMSGGATLVALEEVERGIHPRRIRETLDQLLRVSRSGTQFLLTTHSPLLLSEFRDNPEAVLILERDAQRGTWANVLSELPAVMEQAGEMSLGDLWYSGVLGGVPAR